MLKELFEFIRALLKDVVGGAFGWNTTGKNETVVEDGPLLECARRR